MRYPLPLLKAGVVAAAALLAACDDDGGSGPDRLAPDDVAGVYNLCSMRFTPTNTILPQADLLATVVDTTPPAGRPEATISLSNNVYDLVYTRQSDAFLRQMQGSVSYGTTTITLNATAENLIVRELLLPRPFTLSFMDGAERSLATQTQFTYAVDREDYARATGSSESGLAARIDGALSVTFSSAPCS